MVKNIMERILTFLGVTMPASASIYSFIEKTTPVLAWIGLIISIGVGIGALIINRQRYLEKKERRALLSKIKDKD